MRTRDDEPQPIETVTGPLSNDGADKRRISGVGGGDDNTDIECAAGRLVLRTTTRGPTSTPTKSKGIRVSKRPSISESLDTGGAYKTGEEREGRRRRRNSGS